LRPGRGVQDLSGSIEAIQEGHGEIEDGDVGKKVLGESDGLMAVRGLPDKLKAFPLQESLQALADNRVVVGEENPNRHLTYLRVDSILQTVIGSGEP